MAEPAQIPQQTIDRLRAVCLSLPEAHEERAWTGTRWRIRKETFAHVLMVDAGRPPAYARAAGADGPVVVLTFRSAGPALDALRRAGAPFFLPGWWPDIVGMALDGATDWGRVEALLAQSYRILAPKRLAALAGG